MTMLKFGTYKHVLPPEGNDGTRPPHFNPVAAASFNAGKGLGNIDQIASIKGSIAGAKHVHELSKEYNATRFGFPLNCIFW